MSYTEVSFITKELNSIRADLKQKANDLSKVDKELIDTYHAIEISTLSHVTISHKLCCKLKTILIDRRVLKEDISILHATEDAFVKLLKAHNRVEANRKRIDSESKKSLNKILKSE